METYKRRIVDTELDDLLGALPAIAIEGPKGVGKTATAVRRARSVLRLDDPPVQLAARADPTAVLAMPEPLVIDEWQHVPAILDAVRRAVDEDHRPARFLLAGSAAPATPPTHSGAGRIVSLRMRPLALSERGLAEPTVSLRDLLRRARPPIGGSTTLALPDYVREIIASGYPGLRHLSGRPLRAQLDSYLQRIVDRDFAEQGYRVRAPETLRRWMTAYAAATATSASFEKVRDAATPAEDEKPNRATVTAYREVLERLWIVEPVPGWLPSRNQLGRLVQAPKHHLADPALAARLLGVDERGLLEGATAALTPANGLLSGQLFESLVVQSIRTYAQAAEARVRHLRTKEGRHEIDIIVERGDHRVVALEVKLGGTVDDHDVAHLKWLREHLRDDMLDCVVVTTGSHAYRRPDGIAVVPAVLLGP